MTRTLAAAFLILLLLGPAAGQPAAAIRAAGDLPGSAPVSVAESPAAAAVPSPAVPANARPGGTAGIRQDEAGNRHPSPPVGKKSSIRVKAIECGVDGRGRERVLVTFDRPYRPALKTLPGDRPRVYFDVPGASVDPGVPARQDGRGPLIREVRTGMSPETGSLRVAIELVPARDYVIRPVLYRRENRFLLEIEPKPSRPRRP